MKNLIIKETFAQIHKYGFRKFTIDDIASQLGISKKTIYKYFSSKNQLVSTCIDTFLISENDRILNLMNEDNSWYEKIQVILMRYLNEDFPLYFIDELKNFFPNDWKKIQNLLDIRQDTFVSLLKEGQKMGEVRKDINVEIVCISIEAFITSFLNSPYIRNSHITLKNVLNEFEKIVFYGILSRNNTI